MEEILKNLPLSFQKRIPQFTKCCNRRVDHAINYWLKLEFNWSYDIAGNLHRYYRLFYSADSWYGLDSTPKIYGRNTGTGKADLSELVDELIAELQGDGIEMLY